MSDILEKILQRKREEIAELRQRRSRQSLLDEALAQPLPRGFAQALRLKAQAGQAAVIAEIKKASPSRGLIRADFDPAWIAGADDHGSGSKRCCSRLDNEGIECPGGNLIHLPDAAGGIPLEAAVGGVGGVGTELLRAGGPIAPEGRVGQVMVMGSRPGGGVIIATILVRG